MKLPTLLKSLHPEEYKEFEKFLQSPFFKSSEQYLKYFRCLCKYYPGLELEKADLQAAYKRCFGADSLNDTKLYNLMSGLGKQVEQFLVVRMVIHPEAAPVPLFDQLLVKALGQRNMGAHFRKEAQNLIQDLSALPEKGAADYLLLKEISHEIYFNPDTPKGPEHAPHLHLAAEYLDLYYYTTKLQYAAEVKGREWMYGLQYEIPLLEAVLAQSASPEMLSAHPLLEIYHPLIRIYLNGVGESSFRELLDIFIRHYYGLKKQDQRTLLPHLIRLGSTLLKQDIPVEPALLSLYKLAMEANTILAGNRITHASFMSIFNLACRCGELDWAKAFIQQYANYLSDEFKEPSLALANAFLYYNQGMLDEAQDCLKPIAFQVDKFEIMARMLLLRIAFDRYVLQGKDYEFLMSQITAFEKFVRSRSLSPEYKAPDLNWVKFVRKMAALKLEFIKVPTANKEQLRKRLKDIKPLSIKQWLEKRIDAL